MKKFGLAITVIAAMLSSSYIALADEWDGYYGDDYSGGYSEDYYTDDYSYDSGYGDYSGNSQDYNSYYDGYDYSAYTLPQETTVPQTLPQTAEKAPPKPSTVKALKLFKNNKTLKNQTVKSSADNQAAVQNKGAKKLLIEKSKLIRSGNASLGRDYAKYYGIGAALRTVKGNTFVKGSEVQAFGENGCGVFSYTDGIAYLADTTVKAKKNSYALSANSGEIYGYGLKISSANTAIAAVKNGKIILDKGELSGSSTALIDCSGVTVLNNFKINSKKACVSVQSGKSDTAIFKSDISCNSGYAFSINNSSQISKLNIAGAKVKNTKGGLFSVNNAKAKIALSESSVKINNKDLLSCEGASECSFTAYSQNFGGKISRDPESKLNIYLQNSSKFTGSVNLNSLSDSSKKCKLYIDESSEWVVTGNSHIDFLYKKGKITDKKGNVVPIKATDGTQYAQGKSKYTITVENYFEKDPENGYPKIEQWKNYKKTAPKALGIKYKADKAGEEIPVTAEADTADSEIDTQGKNDILYRILIYAAVAILAFGVTAFVVKSRKK